MERVDGQRIFKEYDPDFHFYVSDPRGSYKSTYGTPLKKITPTSLAEKKKLVSTMEHNQTLWESDYDPVLRCLAQEYQHVDAPRLNVAFFDIETSFDQVHGYSEASEANNYITSVSVYLQWIGTIVCLALPPPTLTKSEAQAIADKVGNTILFDNEADMLNTFMDIIDDADILSSWNGEAYDIPYIVNRIRKVVGKFAASRMCLWDQMPKERKYDRGGKVSSTYDLVGRLHMDYMQLYKQYNYEERHSYSLNAIAEIELGDKKVEYDGTLDELYNDDFEQFLRYNIQDTMLLDGLDKQLQYIDLANQYAHINCVRLPMVMGAVAVTDHAIILEAHNRGLTVPNKKHTNEESRAAGGWVATPKKGLHKWVASTDMKSLYPSVIRAFNMSNETIVGQIRTDFTDKTINDFVGKSSKNTFASWWNDRFNTLEMENFLTDDIATKLHLDLEDGSTYTITGAQLRELVFDKDRHWCISANGTIFRTDVEGVIPALLSRWYAERKSLQKKLMGINGIIDGAVLPDDVHGLFDE